MIAFTCRLAIIEVINIWLLLLVAYIYFEILSEFIDDGPTRFDYERHKAMVNRAFIQDDDTVSEVNQNGNHFRLDTHLRQATLIRSPNNNNVHERSNGNAPEPITRSVSEYQHQYKDELDESVERRLKNYQVVGLSALSPSSEKTKPDYQIREPRRDNRKQSNGVELRPKSAHPVLTPPPRDPEPDYDLTPAGSHVASIRESLQRAAERSSSNEREVHLLNHVPEPNVDNQVGRSSSFLTNRPELRNQLPWSYFKADDNTAPKRSFVNPITGQPVNLDRSQSKSPTPVTEQRGQYEERTVI